MVYLSEKDQIIGRGCVGFDIIEMPWDKETFEEDKKFIIQLINGARNKAGWERLDYSPNEELVSYYLDTFENLIKRMTVGDIRENNTVFSIIVAACGICVGSFWNKNKRNTQL